MKNVRRPTRGEQRRRFAKNPPPGCHIKFTLPIMFEGGADHAYWPTLLSSSMKDIEAYIDEQPEELQMDLRIKLEEARAHWNCERCGAQQLINIKSGFIPCYHCNRMFHQRCVNMEVLTFIKSFSFSYFAI